jgi:P27 family predicted phage terminase small subunit
MKRGPAPTPTALRKLRGNPGRRPYNADEPQIAAADDSFDAVPPELASDAVAAAEWTRLAPLLREARVVTQADRNVLLAACQQWSVYQDALAQSPPTRRVLRSAKSDNPIPNPYMQIAHKSLLHCARLWDALGLTPAARTRVAAAAEQEPGDAFAEFDLPTRGAAPKGPTLNGRSHASTSKPN